MKISAHQVTLALSVFVTTAAQAQIAYFGFTNLGYPGAAPRAPIYDGAGNLLAGTAYMAQLYIGPDQDSLQPLLPVRSFLTGAGAGYVMPTGILTDAYRGGRVYFYQIRAWDATLGATYAEALTQGRGGLGESNIATQWAGIGNGTAASVPGPAIGLQSFSLSPLTVPEPSAYALFGVGVFALWWRCDREGAVRRRWENPQGLGGASVPASRAS